MKTIRTFNKDELIQLVLEHTSPESGTTVVDVAILPVDPEMERIVEEHVRRHAPTIGRRIVKRAQRTS